jgi:hypothetical protein
MKSKKKTRKDLTIAASFEIGPGHKDAMKGKKIYDKGKKTTNPNEKEVFMKRAGPQLPLAKKKSKKRYG